MKVPELTKWGGLHEAAFDISRKITAAKRRARASETSSRNNHLNRKMPKTKNNPYGRDDFGYDCRRGSRIKMHIFICLVGNPGRSSSCALVESLALAEAPLGNWVLSVSQENHLQTISWNVLHRFSNLQSISFCSFSLYIVRSSRHSFAITR